MEELGSAGRAFADKLLDHESRYEQLLEERGGRIARGFYTIRNKLGIVPGVNLVTKRDRSREELIRYHESRRADPKVYSTMKTWILVQNRSMPNACYVSH